MIYCTDVLDALIKIYKLAKIHRKTRSVDTNYKQYFDPDQEFYPSYGICSNFSIQSDLRQILGHKYRLWSEYSGDPRFPIPDPSNPQSLVNPRIIYEKHRICGLGNTEIYA